MYRNSTNEIEEIIRKKIESFFHDFSDLLYLKKNNNLILKNNSNSEIAFLVML